MSGKQRAHFGKVGKHRRLVFDHEPHLVRLLVQCLPNPFYKRPCTQQVPLSDGVPGNHTGFDL